MVKLSFIAKFQDLTYPFKGGLSLKLKKLFIYTS